MCVVGEIEGVLETQARAGCTYTVCTILPLSAYSQAVLSVKSMCSLYVSNTVCRMAGYSKLLPTSVSNPVCPWLTSGTGKLP